MMREGDGAPLLGLPVRRLMIVVAGRTADGVEQPRKAIAEASSSARGRRRLADSDAHQMLNGVQ